MTNHELENFRELLIAQRDELLQATRTHGKIPNERVDTDDNDLTDQANVAVTRNLNNTIAKSEDLLLKKIKYSLEIALLSLLVLSLLFLFERVFLVFHELA